MTVTTAAGTLEATAAGTIRAGTTAAVTFTGQTFSGTFEAFITSDGRTLARDAAPTVAGGTVTASFDLTGAEAIIGVRAKYTDVEIALWDATLKAWRTRCRAKLYRSL